MSILMVTGIEGARNCAAVVSAQLSMEVEVAAGRRDALAALRKREFLAVVVDETLAECDPAAADRICEHTGLAIPLQINFAVSGAARLIREIRSALHRREREQTAGPPRRRGGHRSRVEDHGGRPAAALATGVERERGSGAGGRPPTRGRRPGGQPTPAVERAVRGARRCCWLSGFGGAQAARPRKGRAAIESANASSQSARPAEVTGQVCVRASEPLFRFAMRPPVTAGRFVVLFETFLHSSHSKRSPGVLSGSQANLNFGGCVGDALARNRSAFRPQTQIKFSQEVCTSGTIRGKQSSEGDSG